MYTVSLQNASPTLTFYPRSHLEVEKLETRELTLFKVLFINKNTGLHTCINTVGGSVRV